MLLKSRHAPLQLHQSGVSLQRVAMGILGSLPETQRGNQYADYFTKYTEAFSMLNIEAHTVTEPYKFVILELLIICTMTRATILNPTCLVKFVTC